MAQSSIVKETGEFLTEAAVKKLSASKKEPEWMLKRRLEAFKAFHELPMPDSNYGLHVSGQPNISIEAVRPLETIIRHERKQADDVIIEDLSVATAKYETVLRPLLTGSGEGYRDKLEALLAAFWNSGIFVYAPKRKQKGKPAHVALDLEQAHTSFVAVVVVAEENANLIITESITGTGGEGPAYRIEGDGVVAGPNATVKFATLQKLGTNVNSIIMRRAGAAKDTIVDWADISLGGGLTRQETETALNGEGASSAILGAFFGEESQQLDLLTKAVHNARNTMSTMDVKGALKGRAKAIVQSFTKIAEKASNSDGRQKAHVLLLSENAKASPIPKLEIDNFDVKASHSASVGQLDKEKLFYMMSRGMDEKESIKLVVEGFFEPILKQMPHDIVEELRETIATRAITVD